MADSNEVIVLPATLDLRATSTVMAQILSKRGEPLMLDGSEARKVGAQCLQIILSAERTWERDGVNFALIKPSQELLAAIELAGVTLDGLMEGESAQ